MVKRWFLVLAVVLSLLVVSVATVAADPSYVVQRGDMLYSIARRFSVSMGALIDANQLANPNGLWVGQFLRIPTGPGGSVPGHSGGWGHPYGGAPVMGSFYTVRPGDTLYAIARRYGVSIYALASANGIANLNYLRVGQVLRIPGGGGWHPPAPVPAPAPVSPASVVRNWLTAQEAATQLGNLVTVRYKVISAVKDPDSGTLYLKSNDPYEGYFVTVVPVIYQSCWWQPESYFFNKTIQVHGAVSWWNGDEMSRAAIVVNACNMIMVVQ